MKDQCPDAHRNRHIALASVHSEIPRQACNCIRFQVLFLIFLVSLWGIRLKRDRLEDTKKELRSFLSRLAVVLCPFVNNSGYPSAPTRGCGFPVIFMQRGALFDSTGRYRYYLWREWNQAAPRIGFIMLNPSRADDQVDDPTMRRCIGLAQAWGYGALETANLFAYCTAYPVELRQVADPIGRENDHYLRSLSHHCDRIILAWGNGGVWQGRDRAVLSLLVDQPNLYCLGLTQLGSPRHPLYIPRGASLLPLRDALKRASGAVIPHQS